MSAVLAMTDKRSILFQILFAVFDSLQGFVIVMVHCILRREVQIDFERSALTKSQLSHDGVVKKKKNGNKDLSF